MNTSRWTALLALSVVACGGGGGAMMAPDSGDAPDSGTACPLAPPSSSTACPEEATVCTYGDDPRTGCRTRAQCLSGQWNTVTPTCEPAESACQTPPTAGGQCQALRAVCTGADGMRCECNEYAWRCYPPPGDANCPAVVPNLGTACAPEGTDCAYGGCATGSHVRCEQGAWRNVREACM